MLITVISQPTTMMAELPEVKLFGKWPCEDVQVNILSTRYNMRTINYMIGSGVGHVAAGLHRCEGEVRQVPPSLCWKVSLTRILPTFYLQCFYAHLLGIQSAYHQIS